MHRGFALSVYGTASSLDCGPVVAVKRIINSATMIPEVDLPVIQYSVHNIRFIEPKTGYFPLVKLGHKHEKANSIFESTNSLA